MAARGLTGVEHAGIYNYRCIGGGTPPDCPNGISQHAYATRSTSGSPTAAATTTVNDDWVIDPDDGTTCTASTASVKEHFCTRSVRPA